MNPPLGLASGDLGVRADREHRLEAARAALKDVASRTSTSAEATVRALAEKPVIDDQDLFPVTEPLRPLFPRGGLRRGSTVVVRDSPALLFSVMAQASRKGAWCALVGMPNAGLVAAHEAGIDLDRLALVPAPGAELLAVLAALLDGVEAIAVAGTRNLRSGDRHRVAARARQHGAVLITTDPWPGADVELGISAGGWDGLHGEGHGRLLARHVRVHSRARTEGHRHRERAVLLPGPEGIAAPDQRPVSEGAILTAVS